MSLYAWVIAVSFIGPFILSFDKKVNFKQHWKTLFVGIAITATVFLIWDEYFTEKGIWGFTPSYLYGLYLGKLPIEECLFFVIVPYACVFIHEVLLAYFPTVKTDYLGKIFAFLMACSGLVLAFTHMENYYTLTACSISAILIIGFQFQGKVKWFGSFAFTYLVALIPFLIVNGILTGFFTPEPIVWYNEEHIIGIRIGTIPFEDLYYNLAMLLPIIGIHEWLKGKKKAASK